MSHRNVSIFKQKIYEIAKITLKMSWKTNPIINLHKFLKRYFKMTSRTYSLLEHFAITLK